MFFFNELSLVLARKVKCIHRYIEFMPAVHQGDLPVCYFPNAIYSLWQNNNLTNMIDILTTLFCIIQTSEYLFN